MIHTSTGVDAPFLPKVRNATGHGTLWKLAFPPSPCEALSAEQLVHMRGSHAKMPDFQGEAYRAGRSEAAHHQIPRSAPATALRAGRTGERADRSARRTHD